MKKAMSLKEQIGYNITVKRAEAGFTQQQVADMLKMSRASIVNIEAGRQALSVQRLYEICAAIGAKIPEILPNKFNAFF